MKNLLFLSLLMLCIGCQQETKPKVQEGPILDAKVQEILDKSFKTMGGLKNWQQIKRLQFSKHFRLLDSLGKEEQNVQQYHDYTYMPQERYEYRWEKDSSSYQVVYKNDAYKRYINDVVDANAEEQKLKNAMLSSTFVINIPFKLLDEGVAVSYAGLDTLEGGIPVKVIKATYNPSAHDNHSTPDIWWYYFQEDSHLLEGYMVQHADHYSYVRNLTHTKAGGFTFPKHRKSWRVDKDRNELYLRAEYHYGDYEVE